MYWSKKYIYLFKNVVKRVKVANIFDTQYKLQSSQKDT